MARAKELKFKGVYVERRDPEGNVVISGYAESFPGIPTRDLDEADIAELTDEQYRDATMSGLYVGPDVKKSAAKTPAVKAKAAAKKPMPATPAQDDPPHPPEPVNEDAADGRDADGSRA